MLACSSMALRPLSAVILLALSPTSFGASFTIKNDETVTTQQTLSDNETGTIEKFSSRTSDHALPYGLSPDILLGPPLKSGHLEIDPPTPGGGPRNRSTQIWAQG